MLTRRSPEEARKFLEQETFHWYQRFELAPGVFTPGVADVASRMAMLRLPADLTGKSVLDIATNNGAVCYDVERMGATDILANDVARADFWGFDKVAEFLGLSAKYDQSSIYELPERVEPRDIVFCFGLLYHLRHPLLALDALRAVTREVAFIETQISDCDFPDEVAAMAVSRFYRSNELNNDKTNWFVPNVTCLMDWVRSAGFKPELLGVLSLRPGDKPTRALVRATAAAGPPEHLSMRAAWEAPLSFTARRLAPAQSMS